MNINMKSYSRPLLGSELQRGVVYVCISSNNTPRENKSDGGIRIGDRVMPLYNRTREKWAGQDNIDYRYLVVLENGNVYKDKSPIIHYQRLDNQASSNNLLKQSELEVGETYVCIVPNNAFNVGDVVIVSGNPHRELSGTIVVNLSQNTYWAQEPDSSEVRFLKVSAELTVSNG